MSIFLGQSRFASTCLIWIHTKFSIIFSARKSDGTWSLIVQALVPKEVIKYWTVTIEVSDFKNPDAPVYSFKGKPISYELSAKEAFATGHVMMLKDDQIRPFQKTNTNHLFDYR